SYLYEKNESGYKRFKRLFLKGEAKTELDKEEAINICAEYKNITKLRNDINHINYKAGIEKVESSIKKAIENIKMIIAKVNNGTPAEKETPFVSNIDNCNVSHKAEQKITKSSEYKHNSNGRIDRPKKLKKENKAINPIQKISSDIKMYFIELSKGNDISGEFFTEMSKFSETDAENLKNFISAIQKEGWAKAISNGDYSERLCQLLFSIKQKHTQFSSVWLDNSFESFKLFLTKKFNEDKFYKLLNSLSNKEIKAIFLPNLK
ncbi:MAG: hypothetical protein J5706_03320, partial [Elusimicrobiales bacterium]|nr:hypothetical protein [Elusimicrobiales bacterium]